MNCKHCAQEHDELAMLACFESQVKCWREERDQLVEAFINARTQLAATGCPLCTYVNGKVATSCALHAEVSRLNLQIDALVAALRHMNGCGACAEDSWNLCRSGGSEALALLNKYTEKPKQECNHDPMHTPNGLICEKCGVPMPEEKRNGEVFVYPLEKCEKCGREHKLAGVACPCRFA